MHGFVLNMWIMKRISEDQIQLYVTKKYITQDQANTILAMPQI